MADVLRMKVVPATDESTEDGFALLVFVNEIELTGPGAGMGMDPWEVLTRENQFMPTIEPRTTRFARCTCGLYGCAKTDVVITADDDHVHWDFREDVPLNRRVTFDRDQYLAEVTRVAGDVTWETPERTAGRLIVDSLAGHQLTPLGLRVNWMATDWDDPTQFLVRLADGNFTVDVRVPWAGRSESALASAVVDVLDRTPLDAWNATWSADRPDAPAPDFAPASWLCDDAT